MKVYAVKVRKELAEKKKKELIKSGLLLNFKVKRGKKYVYFPVSKKMRNCVIIDSEPITKEKVNYPFEIIGDIAILEIRKGEKIDKERKIEIAKKIMQTNKNVKAVYCKIGGIKGVYRTRRIEFIIGEKKSETLHKESGCIFKLDVKKVYFSPRLQYERLRIAKQIKENEKILVPFAGVGPFPIVIAKLNKNKKLTIYANELNPVAFKYLKENIKLNKVDIIPIYGDARNLKKMNEKFNRIIMPIPMSSENFLDIPFTLGEEGCIVHFYHFSKNIDETKKIIEKSAKEFGRKVVFIFSREVRSYSKEIKEFVIDFTII